MSPTDYITNEKVRYLSRYYQEDFSDTWDNLNKALKEVETKTQEKEENKYDFQEVMLEKLQCIAKKKVPQGMIRRGYPMTLIRRELHGAYSRRSQRPRTFRRKRMF